MRIGMAEALADPINLNQNQYESLHDGRHVQIPRHMTQEFVVSHVGERADSPVVDEGIEYYRFVV